MIIEFLLLIIGLILLLKGSEIFVKAAASIAKRAGVSEFVIGLTLVAIGTSLPEYISAIFASIKGESGLIMGNILGANIANISLIIGISALIAVIKTDEQMLSRDGYFLLAVAVMLFIAVFNGRISRLEGGLFVLLFVAYTIYLFETKPRYRGKIGFRDFAEYFLKLGYVHSIKRMISTRKPLSENSMKIKADNDKGSIVKDLLMMVFSGFLIVFGARFLVDNAVYFATSFSLPSNLVGVLIAVGTTLPELSVSIAAAKKGLGNIIIGNAIGSCLTNTLLVLGTASLINPIQVSALTARFMTPFLIGLVILLLIQIKSDWELRRKEGILFIILYASFLCMLFIIAI